MARVQLGPADDEEVRNVVEESTDWKYIIFLQFQPIWELFLMVSVFVNALVSLYDYCFPKKTAFAISILYYTCEMMYLLDLILAIMHRNMLKMRKKRSYLPRNFGSIIVDCLTLHPWFEINYFLTLTNYSTGEDPIKNDHKWKCIFRTYRIFLFIIKKVNSVGLNQLMIMPIRRLVELALIGQIFAVIIFKFTKKEPANWTENLVYHQFNRNSSTEWWSLSFMMMASVTVNNWPALIKPENNSERIIFILVMLIGFIMSITLFLGRLVIIFMRINWSYFDYDLHVAKVMRLLHEWEVGDELKSKTFDYYTMFYQQRQGIRDMPDLFQMLPPSLQKEVTVDIYWEALRHSHFFTHTDMSFKRSVSLVMKSEFLLPGEFLFRVGEVKAKMVYLVSGVIQALSMEDDDSPLISFSSGTIFGETACLLPCVSASNLRAVTYCEIQCLHMGDLYQVLSKYPLVTRNIREQLQERLQIARDRITNRRSRQTSTVYTDTSLKKVKENWRRIRRYSKRPEVMPAIPIEERADFTVANLDLLVLSHEVELRVESVCLSGKCPFVMDPDTSFRKCCNYVVITAVVIQSIIIPKAAFFSDKMDYNAQSICVLLDAIYVLDIYLQLSTAVKDKNQLITDFKEIGIRLLKSLNFLVDVLATLPVDYLLMMMQYQGNIALLKLPRLFKIYKIFSVLRSLQYNITMNTRVIRVLKWSAFYLVTIYWCTGLLYILLERMPFWNTVMVTMSSIFGYGGSSIDIYSHMGLFTCFVLSIIGHLTFSFGVAELIATAVLRHKTNEMERVQWWAMKSELVRHKLDPAIRIRLARFVYFQHTSRGCQVVGQHSIFANVPTELRNEIVGQRIIECLKKVPLFQNAKNDVLRYICAHAEIKLIPPGAVLMDTEVKPDSLYVIMRGYCKMASSLPGDLEREATSILQMGDAFPFLETLHDTTSFVNVQCVTVVELLSVKTHVVKRALRTHRRDHSCVKEALAQHRKIYGFILHRKGARLPPLKAKLPSKGKGNIFEYEIHDIEDKETNEEVYKKSFAHLGMWTFIRFLLMKRTIRTNSWPYIAWEVTRCTSLILYILLINVRFSVLSYQLSNSTLNKLSLIFDCIALVDLYVRLHCQYYNENGILVTHSLYTAKHYMKTAFLTDFVGCIPIHSIGLHELFVKKYHLWVQLIISISTRCLQLYRPFKGLNYLDSRTQGKKKSIVNMFRYVLLVSLSSSFGCTLTMFLMCEQRDDRIYCNIMVNSQSSSEIYQYVFYMYTLVVGVTLSSTGNVLQNNQHLTLTVLMLVPLVALRWYFYVSVTSRGVGGNVELTIYRDRMRNYMKFLSGALISNEDKQLIVAHYEYIWKKTHGFVINSVIKNFHPQLEQDLARSFYSNCLESVQLFVGEHISLFQATAYILRQEFYTKDSKIIRCNDINNKLFFVYDGRVDIYIAGTWMCCLRTGGAFGCFSKTGVTRQTIDAIAGIHSLMLAVDTKLFYKTVEAFPNIMEKLQRATALNSEFMPESKEFQQVKVVEKMKFGSHTIHSSFYEKLLIFENNSTYRFFEYSINVHIYPLSSIIILTAIFVNLYVTNSVEIYCICYFSDVVHFVKICCKYHLTYVDPESGSVINDPYLIKKRYLKSQFWLDFFTLLPFEFLAGCYTDNQVIYNLCFLNRTLRFLFFVLYYYQCEELLLMKDHLKWTYMIYSVVVQVHVFLCLWILVACPHTKCWYTTAGFPMNMTESQSTLESAILGYLHVINIYSGTGLKTIFPRATSALTITLFMMVSTQVLAMNLCANYISHLLVNKHNFMNYEVRFQSLGTYLQTLKLSPFLYSKVWQYCLRLWAKDSGTWVPVLITDSPPYLKENVLQILYGRHLKQHNLFCNTHCDFLRQLVVHLERFVFSTGHCIVEKGDADCCMYFINSGEIVQVEILGNTEHYVGTLLTGDSFGEAQGLLCIPHKYSYRSKGTSEVLILNKSKWQYLLKWFPASKEQILETGRSNGLLEADATI